jgi:bifunctional ADP-heptose synthase (sugar kinase/adenylyltransferase)
MTLDELHAMMESFRSKRLLVIGDSIVDVQTYCEPVGLSAETPTIVLRKLATDEKRLRYDEISLGGAALVVRNLLELGAKVDFLTYAGAGKDKHHIETFQSPRLTTHAIYPQQMSSKPVTVKQRFWADGYKLLQVDTRNDDPIDAATEQQAIMQYNILMGNFEKSHDAVVIADYRHGFITEKMAGLFVKNTTDTPVYVSSQMSQQQSNHHWYEYPDAIFVTNEKENRFSGARIEKDRVITKGKLGAVRKSCGATLAITITPVDTCGAGDAFLAAYSLSNSLEFGNLWAGLSCTVKGANPPSVEMAESWVKEHQ